MNYGKNLKSKADPITRVHARKLTTLYYSRAHTRYENNKHADQRDQYIKKGESYTSTKEACIQTGLRGMLRTIRARYRKGSRSELGYESANAAAGIVPT